MNSKEIDKLIHVNLVHILSCMEISQLKNIFKSMVKNVLEHVLLKSIKDLRTYLSLSLCLSIKLSFLCFILYCPIFLFLSNCIYTNLILIIGMRYTSY